MMENREQIFKLMADGVREAQLDNVKLPKSLEEIPERNFDDHIIKKENDSLVTKSNMMAQTVKSSNEGLLTVDLIETISELNESQKSFLQQSPNKKETEYEIKE